MKQYEINPFSDDVVDTIYDTKVPLNKSMNSTTLPPWLQSEDTKEIPLNTSTHSIGSSGSSITTASAASGQQGELDPAIPRMILYTRIINLVLSVLMILTSLLALLTTQSATTGVISCYVVVFSCLLCCFETHLKQVSKLIALNFGFMYSAKSRSIFMLFIGTLLSSFSLFGKIIGLVMVANAGFNIFILFKYPQYEDAQRSDAQSEIKDYLAANPAFASQFMEAGVRASGTILRNNPDLARQSAGVLYTALSNQPPAPADRNDYASV